MEPDGSGGYRVTMSSGLKRIYEMVPGESNYWLVREEDPSGNALDLSYRDGYLEKIQATDGSWVQFYRPLWGEPAPPETPQPRVVRVADSAGRELSFSYDSAGRLTRVKEDDDGNGADEIGYTYSTCVTVTETVNNAARDYWNRATSYRELKETYGWNPGDSMIISKYRPLRGLLEKSNYMFLPGQESIHNIAHEHMLWIRPDGKVGDRGYGPEGLRGEPIVLDQSAFGEMTRLPDGVDPFETWEDSGLFRPSEPSQKFGSPEDGWGLISYNCQDAADWLHEQYR